MGVPYMVDKNWSDFEEYIQKIMEQESIAGAAIAVAQHGEVIYQKGFGVRNQRTQEPVTPETIFGVASITKSFTAMAIMQLEDEGKLSVTDPVTKYLPEFKIHGIEDINSIKIHHLLSHTTGLPPMRRKEELRRLEDHLEYLVTEDVNLLGQPGDYFSYCNDTFLLLGAIIERVTGRLYRRYITEHILDPLSMRRSTFSLEEVEKFKNVTVPYVYNREVSKLEEVPWPALGNYEVGGGVRSTVLDLLKYGQVYVGDLSDDRIVTSRSIVSRDQLKKMWQPVHPIDRNTHYGYALQITPNYSDVTLVEHGGGQPGVSSNFGFLPEKGLVVAVLTNVSGVSASDMWLAAVNTVLGLPLNQKRSVEPYYLASLKELQRLTGTYQSAEGGMARIFLDGDTPKAEVDGQVFVLRPSDEQTLVIEKNGKAIRFLLNNDGVAWAAFYGVRMLPRVE
jgi:CubicO group peptidase (beta-lactamase class C family)